MRIGIFDSGIGGLAVLHHAMKNYPDAEYIYYADEKNVPYGEKTEEQVKEFVEEILDFLIKKDVDAIIIACNTATSVSTKEFRNQFPVPIIGMEPAVKKAVEMYGESGKRILVAATPITIAGNKLHDLVQRVDQSNITDLIPLPGLVRFAEKGEFISTEVEEYLKNELSSFDLNEYEAVVLGCTHFNYFKEDFLKVFPGNIHFVDGNEGTVQQLIRMLPKDNEKTTKKVEFYFSGEEVNDQEMDKIKECLEQLEKVYTIK